jgi:hypothetical protein
MASKSHRHEENGAHLLYRGVSKASGVETHRRSGMASGVMKNGIMKGMAKMAKSENEMKA